MSGDHETFGTVFQTLSHPARAIRPQLAPFEVFRDRLKAPGHRGAVTRVPEMIYLPSGTFWMGDERGRGNERPVHLVAVDAFALGLAPVTWGQYLSFCQATRSHWPQWLEPGSQYHLETGKDDYYAKRGVAREALNLPVVGIGWDDTLAYCEWLSERSGERYALPTEAQWEYACRAGTVTRWSCGDDDPTLHEHAWYAANADGKLHPVAGRRPNPWGLHDMHGNCWEWCADWYSASYYRELADELATIHGRTERVGRDARERPNWLLRSARMLGFGASEAGTDRSKSLVARSAAQRSASANPSGPQSGDGRVIRGGAWYYLADDCRSGYRNNGPVSGRSADLGFRISRTV